MTYIPPVEMQDKQIWTLVIYPEKGNHDEKVPEYYYTKKKMPLLSFDGIKKRRDKNPSKYAPVVGIVSEDYLVIDIDKTPFMPQNIRDLLATHPTYWHYSKSGKGWHIYYSLTEPLPKKSGLHDNGEWYNGAFVTTIDYHKSDHSQEQIAQISPSQVAEFLPKLKQKLEPRDITTRQNQQGKYLDGEKLLNETKMILKVLPIDPDPLLTVAYETRLRDVEVNRLTHWRMVSHALSDLATQLASEYPSFPEKIAQLFLEWSRNGSSYVSDDDVLDRWDRSYEETQQAAQPIVTFKTLRKLFWSYRIPIDDFPVVSIKGKDKKKSVDVTDPQNYAFLTKLLKLQLCQDYTRGDIYVRGPKSLISNYFKDKQYYFHTHSNEDLSIPFQPKFNSDYNLLYRLVDVFRQFGIKGALRNHPLTSGLTREGVKPIDTLYEWMNSKPWDKTERAMGIIEQSLDLDPYMTPSEIPDEFYYQLALKHLIHMAGLRAKANRLITNNAKQTDRFRKGQGILILAGYQNTRKSTWIECLLPSQAGAISSVTPSSVKDTLEIQRALAGTFVLNIDEVDAVLDSINLSDFKNVLTQEKDTFRTMYSGKFEDHPRAAGFFGTTNKNFLKLDRTGNRRFWIIPIKRCNANALIKCDYQQFWAELLYYAETMSNDEWMLTEEQKELIDITAGQYSKQTLSGKSIDMLLTDDAGESKVYTHRDIDMMALMDKIPQTVQRAFAKESIFLPVSGNKAFKHFRAMAVMDDDIDLKLGSFNHEIGDYIDNVVGLKNKTIAFSKGVYKSGIYNYDTGKPTPTKYHFIPFKDKIDKLVAEGLITITKKD